MPAETTQTRPDLTWSGVGANIAAAAKPGMAALGRGSSGLSDASRSLGEVGASAAQGVGGMIANYGNEARDALWAGRDHADRTSPSDPISHAVNTAGAATLGAIVGGAANVVGATISGTGAVAFKAAAALVDGDAGRFAAKELDWMGQSIAHPDAKLGPDPLSQAIVEGAKRTVDGTVASFGAAKSEGHLDTAIAGAVIGTALGGYGLASKGGALLNAARGGGDGEAGGAGSSLPHPPTSPSEGPAVRDISRNGAQPVGDASLKIVMRPPLAARQPALIGAGSDAGRGASAATSSFSLAANRAQDALNKDPADYGLQSAGKDRAADGRPGHGGELAQMRAEGSPGGSDGVNRVERDITPIGGPPHGESRSDVTTGADSASRSGPSSRGDRGKAEAAARENGDPHIEQDPARRTHAPSDIAPYGDIPDPVATGSLTEASAIVDFQKVLDGRALVEFGQELAGGRQSFIPFGAQARIQNLASLVENGLDEVAPVQAYIEHALDRTVTRAFPPERNFEQQARRIMEVVARAGLRTDGRFKDVVDRALNAVTERRMLRGDVLEHTRSFVAAHDLAPGSSYTSSLQDQLVSAIQDEKLERHASGDSPDLTAVRESIGHAGMTIGRNRYRQPILPPVIKAAFQRGEGAFQALTSRIDRALATVPPHDIGRSFAQEGADAAVSGTLRNLAEIADSPNFAAAFQKQMWGPAIMDTPTARFTFAQRSSDYVATLLNRSRPDIYLDEGDLISEAGGMRDIIGNPAEFAPFDDILDLALAKVARSRPLRSTFRDLLDDVATADNARHRGVEGAGQDVQVAQDAMANGIAGELDRRFTDPSTGSPLPVDDDVLVANMNSLRNTAFTVAVDHRTVDFDRDPITQLPDTITEAINAGERQFLEGRREE